MDRPKVGRRAWLAADLADVGLGAAAVGVVPVAAPAPRLGAVLVARAVALRLAVLPVVRLAGGPVLVVGRRAVHPDEGGGLDVAADALVAGVGAAGLRVAVVVANPGYVRDAAVRDDALENGLVAT